MDPTGRNRPLRLGVLASGGGTNLQAILDRIQAGSLMAEVRVVISNNSSSGALDRARRRGIPTAHLSGQTHPTPGSLDAAILQALRAADAEVVVLAGYMKRLGPGVLAAFSNRIVNVHPALLPAFGGQGMYGERVHGAVLKAGVKLTGVTVHLVDEVYDHGPIIAQRAVAVEDEDSVASLSERVLRTEHDLLPEVLGWLAAGRIRVEGRRAFVQKG